MAMVPKLRSRIRPVRVVGSVIVVALAWASTMSLLLAEAPSVHYEHAGVMPPGAIGGRKLLRGGPLPGYFQPVEISGPEGLLVATVANGAFDEPQGAPLRVGLLIGGVYRLRVTNIPLQPGFEVYPTIEVIDRLYPPVGQEFKFPIPVDLSQEELEMALEGRFVTRVIYLEDPEAAEPIARDADEQAYFEVQAGDDPLAVADTLGRPVAILRMGARVPGPDGPDETFLYGSPPLVKFHPCRQQEFAQPALPQIVRGRAEADQLPLPIGRSEGRWTAAP